MDEEIREKRSNDGRLFSLAIMVLTAVIWMSLDIYLPALPVLKSEFDVSASYLNVTLTAGIITTAVGTLLGGPFSDKYGRRPLFIIGTILSVIFTFLCTFAEGVEFLIVVRGISGLGNGIILTVTTAMIKDMFSGVRFKYHDSASVGSHSRTHGGAGSGIFYNKSFYVALAFCVHRSAFRDTFRIHNRGR